MSNIMTLTGIYLKQLFGRYFFGSKAKKRGLAATIAIIVLLVAIIEWSISQMVYTFAKQLSLINLQQFIIVYGLIISALFSIFIVSYEIPSHFYKSKDYETLASLPISNWVVVSAKFLSGFISAFVYSIMFTLPTFVIYFIFNPITVSGIIFSVLSLVFIPMFVMFISCIVGFIINIITSKMKNKTVLNTIFMFIFVGVVFGFSATAGSGFLTNMFVSGQCPLAIKIVAPYIYFIFQAIYLNSFVYFLYFLLVNLAYIGLAILIVTLSYKKINSNLLISHAKISKKPLTFDKKSQLNTLLNKESKTFFGSTLWSMNTLAGPIMVIAFSIIWCVLIITMKGEANSLQAVDMFKGMYLGVVAMFAGMAVTTSVSISMEGKKIQILKQLPISFRQVATSKILFNIILQLPFIFVANIIFLCAIPFDVWYTILAFAIPVLSITTFSILGLLINLKFPKLVWNSEAEAIKQSMSLFVSMFSDMIIGILPTVVYFSLYQSFFSTISVAYFGLINLGWFLIWFVVSYVLMKCYGKKLYSKLS